MKGPQPRVVGAAERWAKFAKYLCLLLYLRPFYAYLGYYLRAYSALKAAKTKKKKKYLKKSVTSSWQDSPDIEPQAWVVVGVPGVAEKWAKLTKHLCLLLYLRPLWATLGHYLRLYSALKAAKKKKKKKKKVLKSVTSSSSSQDSSDMEALIIDDTS